MAKDIIEAEIIEEPKGFTYKERYSSYTKQAKRTSGLVWAITLLSLFFSLIPIFGFVFAWIAFFINVIKKIPPVIPIISLIISSFITTGFIFIVWILRLIF